MKFSGVLKLHIWDIALLCLLVGITLLSWKVLFPIVQSQWTMSTSLAEKVRFLEQAPQLPRTSENLSRQIVTLDSLIRFYDTRKSFSEPVVLEQLYTLADSARLTITKIQIETAVSMTGGIEIPVQCSGAGDYRAIGKFIAGIENSEYAARVRQITLKNASHGNVSMICDFVIMESTSL